MRDFAVFGRLAQSAAIFPQIPVGDLLSNLEQLKTMLEEACALIELIQSDRDNQENKNLVDKFTPLYKAFKDAVEFPGTNLKPLENERRAYDKYIYSLLKGS